MALLQIAEPGKSASPHEHKHAVGIDLGTTNSLVATVRGAISQALVDESGKAMLPSVVRYLENGEVEIGEAAKSHAQVDPSNTIISVKRFMGRGVEDVGLTPYTFEASVGGMANINTAQGLKSPVQVSADILTELSNRAMTSLAVDKLDGVVITVPAYFDESQRQATKDAARIAGLHVLRLLNEPTAAAIAYGLEKKEQGTVLVYDLGGGTFDASLLRLHEGVFEVLATGGDSALGGDDFDIALAEHFLKDQCTHSLETLASADFRMCINKACEAKELLAEREQVDVHLGLSVGEFNTSIDRDTFAQLIEKPIKQTIRTIKRVIKDAKLTIDEVDQIVMVGGSTRTLAVREAVEVLFNREPLTDIDPDQVVALGAAKQADILIGNAKQDDLLLLDVTPLSLGLETMGGLVEKVIPRNTTIPVARAQEFTTFKDGQTAMSIHVVQGERELVSDCRSLARFELRGIPPLAAGGAKIRVTFQIDADGIMQVSALEVGSGVQSQIEVKPSFGLNEDEVIAMLQDSKQFAHEDKDARQLGETKVEAERVLEAVVVAIDKDGEALLSADELKNIMGKVEHLIALLPQNDEKQIKAAMKLLVTQSDEFAARRMDAGIKAALAGKAVDEF